MRERRPGARAIGVSLALHGIVLVPLIGFARPPEPIRFETVRVKLVSPPPAAERAPALEAPVEQTQEPEPEPDPPPEPEPEPEPEPQAPEPRPQPPEKEPEPEREEPPEPKEQTVVEPDAPEEGTGGDDLDINVEGREFPYPEYLNNVLVQINRYLRWNQTSRPRSQVYFEILPDGSVRNFRTTRPSGNPAFDLRVMGAVESAGNRGAFGPLPEGYAGSSLPIQLEVEPPR